MRQIQDGEKIEFKKFIAEFYSFESLYDLILKHQKEGWILQSIEIPSRRAYSNDENLNNLFGLVRMLIIMVEINFYKIVKEDI